MWLSLVERCVRDTILINSASISRTPTNLLTPPLYGDIKNKIHVVKSVLTTCYPTDTGDTKKSNILYRDVAQFGSALRSGRRGRRFKSCHPDHVGTSFACSDFYLHKNQSLTILFLLFHKKSRSARLFGCKRPHNDSLSLPTFCEFLRFLRFLFCLKFCEKSILTTIFYLQLWNKVLFFVYTLSKFNTPKSDGTDFYVRAICVIMRF